MDRAAIALFLLPLLAGCLRPTDPFETIELGEGSLYIKNEDGRHEVVFRERGSVTRVELMGDLLLSPDGREVVSLGPRGSLVVWQDERAVSLEQQDGELARTYVVAGKRRDWTPAASEWLEDVLELLARRTSIGAAARGRSLLAARGPDALVTGMPELESSSAKEAWAQLVLETPALDPALLARLAAAAARIPSDSARVRILSAIAPRHPGELELTRALLEASDSIASSSGKASVLTELARERPLTRELAPAIFAVAGTIPSDSARRDVLIELLDALPLDAETIPRWLAAVCALSSSSNQEAAFRALLARAGDDPVAATEAARALACIASEMRRTGLAAELAAAGPADPALFQALLDLAAGLTSSSRQEELLLRLLARPELDAATLDRLVEIVGEISSTSTRARLQELLLERLRPGGMGD